MDFMSLANCRIGIIGGEGGGKEDILHISTLSIVVVMMAGVYVFVVVCGK